MSNDDKNISRRQFIGKAATVGALGLGLTGLEGFCRLANAVASKAGGQREGTPGRPGGSIAPADWDCSQYYCDVGQGGAGFHAGCGQGQFGCSVDVRCSEFDCYGGDDPAYGCTTRRFACISTFNCGQQEGQFNCRIGQFTTGCGSCWTCWALYCYPYPYAQPEPPPPPP
jgi:hypothetical protein